MNEYEEKIIAERCMLSYLQSWGQPVEKKIEALNNAASLAGIKAQFEQNNKGAYWVGDDADLGAEFRERLHSDVFCGEFHQEVRNILTIISEFKSRTSGNPATSSPDATQPESGQTPN